MIEGTMQARCNIVYARKYALAEQPTYAIINHTHFTNGSDFRGSRKT